MTKPVANELHPICKGMTPSIITVLALTVIILEQLDFYILALVVMAFTIGLFIGIFMGHSKKGDSVHVHCSCKSTGEQLAGQGAGERMMKPAKKTTAQQKPSSPLCQGCYKHVLWCSCKIKAAKRTVVEEKVQT